MTSKKHRMIVYGLAAHLLVIAIVCYAAFPVEKPEEPIRIMYQTAGGNVLFDHQKHTGASGYGLSCYDCHHHPSDAEEALVSCGDCHLPKPKKDGHPESCFECHEDESEIEGSEYPKRLDALHQQCMGCHEELEKGPQSGDDDCLKCHIK